MIKSLLSKSKGELVRIILLLLALVLSLGLLSATKLFTIEKEIKDVSGYTIRPNTDPYEVVEPTGGVIGTSGNVAPEDEFSNTIPVGNPRCFRFRTFKICGPYF